MSQKKQKEIRTFSQFILSLRNTVWRLLIYFEILGWKLPGRRRAREELEDQTVAYFDRKKILRELRSARFRTQFGPLWFRPLNDSFVVFWEQNRFWAKIFFKLFAGIVFVSVPFSIFTVIRGILPVPERVPVVFQPKSPDPSAGFFASYQPYFAEDGQTQILVSGALPRKMVHMNGFFVTEKKPLKLLANQSFRPSVSGRSFVKFEIQSGSEIEDLNAESCELLVHDERGQELFRGVFAPDQKRGLIASEARRIFQSRLTPQFDSLAQNRIPVTVNANRFPSQLIFWTRNLVIGSNHKTCSFSVSSPYFQMEQTHSRRGNGVLLIVAEGLGVSDTVPNDWAGVSFGNHRVLHSERKASIKDILELDSVNKTLPETFANNGFATFYAGENFEPNLTKQGFQTTVSLETTEYSARHATEEFAKWLSEKGGAGFFATLKYDLLTPPYRPPFAEIDLWTLFKNPFGLKRERSLRKSSNQSLNAELSKLKEHLIDQKRWDSTDVILTSNAPIHLRERIWNPDNQANDNTPSAARSFASTTWEVDTRVPLHWKNSAQNDAILIASPSSHRDLASFIRSQFDFGVDNPPQKTTVKKSLPLVGQDEIAVLDFNENNKAIKYVFPFRPRKIDVATRGFPFRETKVLAPEERLTSVNEDEFAVDLSEIPLNAASSNQVGNLRKDLIKSHFDKGTPIKYENDFEDLYLEQEFGSNQKDSLYWAEVPNGIAINAAQSTKEHPFRWSLKGTLTVGNSLKIFWKDQDLKIISSNVGWASVCGGSWKVSWQTILDLSSKTHPCLFQQDRIRELSGFKRFALGSKGTVNVSLFHNTSTRQPNP